MEGEQNKSRRLQVEGIYPCQSVGSVVQAWAPGWTQAGKVSPLKWDPGWDCHQQRAGGGNTSEDKMTGQVIQPSCRSWQVLRR